MSFPKTLPGDKMASLLATAAGAVSVWGIYMLGPDTVGFTITIAASLIAFMIGRAFSSPNLLGPTLGFCQTVPVMVCKRRRGLAPNPVRELSTGNFRVEDWQHGEYA
jgi:hypothetical protein